jgi:hypothetical protein
MVENFGSGGTSEDLRIQFERDHSLGRQMFYYALSHCKQQGWLRGGGGSGQPYFLDPSGSWKPPVPSIGERLETDQREKARLEFLVDTQAGEIQDLRDRVESLRDLASGTNGIAVGSLVRILSDPATSPRQQLRAASVVLGYRAQDPAVTELAKRCLETLCARGDSIDYRIEASELLRRVQDPKVMPQIERPSIAPRHVDTEEEIAERSERRRKHLEEQSRLDQERLRQERKEHGWTWPSAPSEA